MPHILHIIFSFSTSIYSIDTLLYPYTLPLITFPLTSLKSLPKCNLNSCHMQVHSSRNYIPTVKTPPKHTSLPSIVAIFLQHVLWRCYNYLDISSSTVEILLFNLVFYNKVIPVSVSTLKPLLGVIGVLLLKLQASPIYSIYI